MANYTHITLLTPKSLKHSVVFNSQVEGQNIDQAICHYLKQFCFQI